MKKKYSYVIIAVLLAIILLLLTLLVKPSHKDNEGKGVTFEPHTENSGVHVGTTLPDISIPGWTAIKLPAKSTEADISLHNPQVNEGYYALSFTLKLADTGEMIFATGSIEPGYRCTHVTLNRELEPGEYYAILFVQPYLLDGSETPTNNAELEILLIVE